MAFITQTAFIFGASVRENILFGLPYEGTRYQHAVDSASLGPDLENLPGVTDLPPKNYNPLASGKKRVMVS